MRARGCLALAGLLTLTACAMDAPTAFVIDRSVQPPPPRATLAGTPSQQPIARAGGTYVVRSGDTLSEIAERAQIDMGQLARLNGIPAPYNIRAGQTLLLPGSLTASLAPTGQLPLLPTTIQGQIEVLQSFAPRLRTVHRPGPEHRYSDAGRPGDDARQPRASAAQRHAAADPARRAPQAAWPGRSRAKSSRPSAARAVASPTTASTSARRLAHPWSPSTTASSPTPVTS